MKQVLYLPQFPSLNEYISAMNRHRMKGNAMKADCTDEVTILCKHQKIQPYLQPIELAFLYREKKANRDPDNITFAKKFILDGMVNAGIIPNDTQKYIKRFTEEWVVDAKNPGVTVTVKEWEDGKQINQRPNSLVGNSTN